MRRFGAFAPAPRGLAAIALLLFSHALCAEDEVLVIKDKQWAVGVAAFRADDADLAPLANLIVRLISDELTGVDEHRLSEFEKELLARQVRDEMIQSSYERLADLHDGRDQILFDTHGDAARRREAEENLEAEQKTLAYWEAYPLSEVVLPETLEVVYPASDADGGAWEFSGAAMDAYRKKMELDALISGDIVHVGDYYGINAFIFTDAGKEVLWQGAGKDSEIAAVAQSIGAKARGVVLGRPWAALTVEAEPSEAQISIDGRRVGVGYWENRTLVPGESVIEFSAQGYAPQAIREHLEAGESRAVSVVLEAVEQPQVLVRSIPTGASVRLNTLWLGRTPLAVRLPDRAMPLTLSKEGYRSRTVPLVSETERLTVPLTPDILDEMEVFAASRKKLQNSITIFAASFVPTLVLIGLHENYRSMYVTAAGSGAANVQEAQRNSTLTNGLMWGSVALNVGALAFVLVRLSRYLKAAEALTE